MAEHLSTLLHAKTRLRKKLLWGESFGNAVRSLELTTSERKDCTKRKIKRRKNNHPQLRRHYSAADKMRRRKDKNMMKRII
jgi:hypothetical protein